MIKYIIHQKLTCLALVIVFLSSCGGSQVASNGKSSASEVKGWNILSDNYEAALATIDKAKEYDINHLQLSHHLIMDLNEVKDQNKRDVLNKLIEKGHQAGIEEVTVWDHALYDLDYYPAEFRTGPDSTLNLDNPEFWSWFKQDYRDMMKLIPDVDGIILTFIETGARAERQYSEKLVSEAEKLATVVDAVADVICDELNKKLYIRTFAYTDKEYEVTIGSIDHIKSQKVILMMKETPHDFFLTHPNDKFAGTINRPTIIEFDTGNEFNGQGVIANTWPEYVIGRWSNYLQRDNIIGYVARGDRYGDTHIVGTPNEILLYALKRYTEEPGISADKIYDEFITNRYGDKALAYLKPAFQSAFDIVSSSLYTLGTNMANHSALNFDPYKSSYGRHVSGKWLDPAVVHVGHDVNKEFHYWKDVIEHLSPALFKGQDAALRVEAPVVLENKWVTPTEKMNDEYLRYVIIEKKYSVSKAKEALELVIQAKPVLSEDNYAQVYNLFHRTYITARLYEAVATAYFGYRIYAQGEALRTPWLKETLNQSLKKMLEVAGEIENYSPHVPSGQWKWKEDAKRTRDYYENIAVKGWKEYGNVVFKTAK